jgi:sec-independent protein translocase protein TatA
MGSFSIFHWLLVLVVILILFGAGRLPSVMGDLAKGIKAFRSGLKDEGDKPADTVPPATPQVTPPLQATTAPSPQPAPAAQPSESRPVSHPAPPVA